jgi:replication-associated recombination protein RarA
VCVCVCVYVCVCVLSMRAYKAYNKTKDTQAHSHLLTWPKHLGQANCAAHIQARRASNENALRVLGLEGIDQAF